MVNVGTLLLDWFENYGRSFNFRWQADPFVILITEVLLRQTQAAQVASIFPLVLEQYGTPELMANANETELRVLIKPLGITSRAKKLGEIAQIILRDYRGSVPPNYKDLTSLPSVGDYIASCVLVLGYDQILPLVDVNVTRVIGRFFGAHTNVHKTYENICPKEAQKKFHYAILDFGQLICTHKAPKCNECPMQELCAF